MSSQRDEYYASNNDRSSITKGYSFQAKSPKKKNELANLYEQLKETNTKLKEGPSQGNSILIGDTVNESMERGNSVGNLSRIKEEEIRRMRTEKLDKIRAENQKTSSRNPENRELSAIYTNLPGNTAPHSLQRDASPQFFTEKTLDNKTARSGMAKETFYNPDKEETERGLDENNIDIARDYLFYSGNKFDPQQSVSQPEYPLYDEAEKYPQVKLFKRQKDIERTEKLLQEQVKDEIKKLANTSKMSQNSYKIMIRKLESSLSSVLMEVDKAGRKLITFEQLGRIFTLLEIFRIIQYDENYNLENEEQFFAGNVQDQKRRYQEMVIHEEIWKLLAGDEESDYIDTEFLYVTFRILLDPVNLTASATAKILQDYIDRYRRDEHEGGKEEIEDISVENLQLVELVKNFKKLTENRLHYNKTGYLKAAKAEDLARKNEQLTFKPKISELSQAIDRYHTQRLIEQDVGEKKERSPSPQQATMKENLDNLLFDLKGMQTTFQGKGENNARAGNYGNESMLSRERESALNLSKRQNFDPIDSRVQVIYKKHEIAEKRKNEQRKQKKLEDMKECTFQPLIKNYKYHGHRDVNETVNRLYNHHIIKKKKEEERIMEQIEKETREMEECTFKPDINSQAGVGGPKGLPRGFEQNVIRMRNATDEAKKKKEALEKVSKGENYEKLKKAKVKPFTFLENPKHKRDPPFVYIEINVAPGRTGRIGIHEDDDPRILAKNFAVAFQITDDMERNLEEIITQQLHDHFAKKDQENMA